MLRWILLPFALIALALFAMTSYIVASTVTHRLAWLETTAVVRSAETIPVLHPKLGYRDELSIAIDYPVDSKHLAWQGFGKDIGVYQAREGDSIVLLYDPNDPRKLDTAAMKGWRGGLLVLAVTGGAAALYLWFFWLRGGPPSRPNSTAARLSRRPSGAARS